MIVQNDVTFVLGDAILGLVCLAMPPTNTSGIWYEVGKCPAKSTWVEIKPYPAPVVYKGEEKCP